MPTETDTVDSAVDDTPDLTAAGLTDDQYQSIESLLSCALYMNVYFQDGKTLKSKNLLDFLAQFVSDNPDIAESTYSKEYAENIINSAFGIVYHAKNGDTSGDGSIVFKNGKFMMDVDLGPDATWPAAYSVTRIAKDRLLFKLNLLGVGDDCCLYMGKAEAVVQEDSNSQFGYRIVSLVSAKDPNLRFTTATASSCLPKSGKKTFNPENVIDNNDATAWVTEKGVGEWILLSFNGVQPVTGLDFKVGDWTNEDTMQTNGQPSTVRMEFSDGTIVEDNCEPGNGSTGVDDFEAFDKVIMTSYIKITILDVDTDNDRQAQNIYITDVTPY